MIPPRIRLCAWILLAGFLTGTSNQASPVLKEVEFTHTQDVGFGNEVFVSGPSSYLGGDNPLAAIKLSWTSGNVWRGRVALPAGETLTYRFLRRGTSVSAWGSSATVQNLTANQTVSVPSHAPAPWNGKTVFLYSTWSSVQIFWRDRTGGGNWTFTPMREVGSGRQAGEKLYRVDGLAAPGAELEFVFTNGSDWLNAPAPPNNPATGAAPAVPAPYQGMSPPYNFRTRLDVLFVQDQQVFNYRPPATVSPPSRLTRQVDSTVATIPGRPITIYLPRGYAENSWKKYPVLYFHDGQNVLHPGGPFGTWDADRIATYEISQGRMRECILVAIPNGNAYGSDRLREYLPNGDSITLYGGQTVSHIGAAAQYTAFLLDNVAPTLDVNYRTFGTAAETFVAGSSMGGLASDFIGQTRSDRFGGVGIFSPAYWAAPNFVANRSSTLLPVRRFLSMGTAESSTGESSSNVYWNDALLAYNTFLRSGQAVGRDLHFIGVSGGQHNEPAWSRLLPNFYQFMLPPWREASLLALEHFPPTLSIIDFDAAQSRPRLQRRSLYGYQQILQGSSDLQTWQDTPLDPASETWEVQDLRPTGNATFWRLRTALP